MNGRRLLVVGAGPVGLEAALAAVDLGFDVRVCEAGRVGEHLRRFRDVALFTPFAMNSTERTRERLRLAGARLPAEDAFLTAGELADRYLAPIAGLPELRGRLEERCRIAAIGRAGASKAGESGARAARPFLLRAEGEEGDRFLEADIVVDASGVVGRPRAFGPGGLEAYGEAELGDRVDRHLPPTRDEARARFSGRRVLLVGSGHSAATALVDLDALARAGEGPARAHWVHRVGAGGAGAGAGGSGVGVGAGGAPFLERAGDPLPARLELARRANAVAARAGWLERYPDHVVEAVEPAADGSIEATLAGPNGAAAALRVDRVLSLVGYRPDTDLYRELQVHACYASEAPMALAAALARARSADPSRAGDCLAQTTHGPETLRTTEPGFFVIGSKSYGRSPDFLLRVGYEQARDLASLLAPLAARDPLEAPA